MPADGSAEPAILVVDASGLGQSRRSQCGRGRVRRQAGEDAHHPLHRPPQVDGSRPRAGEEFGPGQHVGQCRLRREPVMNGLARRDGQAVGPGDADRGCTADPQ